MKIETSTASCPAGTIKLFTITNASGASVTLSSLGAGIVSLTAPDAEGKLADVVLGYKDPASYLNDGPCAGKIPGRYANRIGHGTFSLRGKEYHLEINNGPNALHGGTDGFQNRLWDAAAVSDDTVEFTLHSPDGDAGYSGNLMVKASYKWTDDCTLTLNITATTDAPTVVNLTNHAYFNLDGEDAGSVLGHELKLSAPSYLVADVNLLPTGELDPVEGTPMDFLDFNTLGSRINADFPALKFGKGYDTCFAAEDYATEPHKMRTLAMLRSPRSRRTLTVESTQPGIQVYTGNWLSGCPESISGHAYSDYDGVALECQHFPDSPNHPEFPTTELLPDGKYDETIIFKFATY
ncbi:MAG: galactose mutarotase [Bacteroides sp.]|nr:galactose mutarotase [Bacteroides sp.]